MKEINKYFLMILTWLTIAGCATQTNIPADYKLSEHSGKGVLIAGVSFSGMQIQSMHYQLRNLSTQEIVDLFVNPNDQPLDWRAASSSNSDDYTGRVAAIELSAGAYEITTTVVQTGGYIYTSKKKLGFKFRIQQGKSVYIGAIHTFFRFNSESKEIFSRAVRADLRERDLPIIKKRFPSVAGPSLEYQIDAEQVSDDKNDNLDSFKDILPKNRDKKDGLDDFRNLLPKK